MAAMQRMKASARNPVLRLGFFCAPVVLAAAAAAPPWAGDRLATGRVADRLGAFLLWLSVNAPMNAALAGLPVPQDRPKPTPSGRPVPSADRASTRCAWRSPDASLALTAAALLCLGRAQGRPVA